MLLQRRPTYFVADPIVRLGQLVIEPYRELLEERQSEHVWAAAQASVSAHILGPHFERLAQTWTPARRRQRTRRARRVTWNGWTCCARR